VGPQEPRGRRPDRDDQAGGRPRPVPPASGQAFTALDQQALDRYAALYVPTTAYRLQRLRAGLPARRAIASILRFQMYFSDYGDQKRAMQEYAGSIGGPTAAKAAPPHPAGRPAPTACRSTPSCSPRTATGSWAERWLRRTRSRGPSAWRCSRCHRCSRPHCTGRRSTTTTAWWSCGPGRRQRSGSAGGRLPASLGGRQRVGAPRPFSRDTLYEYVNGHAEYYLSAGFEGLAVGEYGADAQGQPSLVVNLWTWQAAARLRGPDGRGGADAVPLEGRCWGSGRPTA